MQNWIFFPEKNKRQDMSREGSLELLLYLLSQDQRRIVTRDEWHEFIPESKEKPQTSALGFFCGDLPGKIDHKPDLYHGLPEVEVRPYKTELQILAKAMDPEVCFTLQVSCRMPEEYRIGVPTPHVISVPGMLLLDRAISVHGSRLTRFSKYKIR